MNMRGNLVKCVRVVHDDKNDKNVRFTNLYLEFDNGVVVAITPKFYQCKSTDKKDIEKCNKFNTENYTKLITLADLKDEE